MVNELRELMHEATDRPPRDRDDLPAVLAGGRHRVRVRRAVAVGGTALAAGAIALGSVAWLHPAPADLDAAGVTRAEGPVVRLAEARPAVEGRDYRELASVTNEDLDADNGVYFDGVTDDGLVLFRDGPRGGRPARFALMDPTSGEKDWLPESGVGQSQSWAVELSEERLVLITPDDPADPNGGSGPTVVAHVFDRGSREWATLTWPALRRADQPWSSQVGPDGRLYVLVPATRGQVPDGGWPVGPDGEAEDADAEGDTYELWSASLTDTTDVRQEGPEVGAPGLRVGSFDFTADALVWTDSTNGAAGRVHLRDLTTGEETSFDPEMGERCNLLGFSASPDRIALAQYCGTYDDGVRDDRIQVVTTAGEQVVTLQDTGVSGGRLVTDGDVMILTSYDRATRGTYVYDFASGRLLRLSDGFAQWEVATGPTPDDQFMWAEPAGVKVGPFGRRGASAFVGEIIR